MTLAFLGESSFSQLRQILPSTPHPSFQIGPIGIGNELLFLPPEKSRVVALSVKWLDLPSMFESYQRELADWIKDNGFPIDERPFLSHITIARSPFDKKNWLEHFTPLPLFVKSIHLYQSMGNLEYKSLWDIPLLAPFEEFEHTADIAFHIRGNSLQNLYQNAQLALAFKFPLLIEFFSTSHSDSLNEIIISLNEIISKADTKYGCPFKAVSFYGNIKKDHQNILHWEMIVDV